MGNMKKHARIYDHEWMSNQDQSRWVVRGRMRERWARLKEQQQNDANQPIVQPIEVNIGNYYLCNLNFILILICLLFLIHNFNFIVNILIWIIKFKFLFFF